ncbi:MAG: 30S ribosomal protein S20 [Verrucomicrobia bacterium]|nr:30S ribosomal protein S20 [Verrucomicrobiota bacterium]
MPNIKSAKKRLRTSELARQRNLPVKTRVKTARKKLDIAVEAGDKDAIGKAYSAYCSSLDKAVKAGVVQKNTAVRHKSRSANRIRAKA